ncbi:NHRF2 protein, partial [Atractosteus spatula]|nr:NHRF2 protein [Atractosteus spatula]
MTKELKPRLCLMTKGENGYGFHLHGEKGKSGQYIRKVELGSPAEAAGLRAGDRVVEVNGENVEKETHHQVVQRIKALESETRLLVVDRETDEYLKSARLTCSEDMARGAGSGPTPRAPPSKKENGSILKQPVALSNEEPKRVAKRTPSQAGKKVGASLFYFPTAPHVSRLALASSHGRQAAGKCQAAGRTIEGTHDNGHVTVCEHKHSETQTNTRTLTPGPVSPDINMSLDWRRKLEHQEETHMQYGENIQTPHRHHPKARIEPRAPALQDSNVDQNRSLCVSLSPDVFKYRVSCLEKLKEGRQSSRCWLPWLHPGFSFRSRLVKSSVLPASGGLLPGLQFWAPLQISSGANPMKEYHPRMCHLKRSEAGYGFNLHSEKSKPGQFIRSVDPGSPAARAGLRPQDRLIEVNDVNIEGMKHSEVVAFIKSSGTEARLLVVDVETDEYFRKLGVTPTENHVKGFVAQPITNGSPKPQINGSSTADSSQSELQSPDRTTELKQVEEQDEGYKDPFAESGLRLSPTAAEAKEKAHAKRAKKRAPQMDWNKKHEIFSNF